jgi:CBS domain-containing protein
MTAKENPDRTRLRAIMLKRYLRLGEGHTIAEVMGFLSEPHFEENGLPYLVVIGRDGSLAGMLSAKDIFRTLAGDPESEAMEDEAFLKRAGDRLGTPVGEIMNRDIPSLHPDAFLEDAFICIQETATDAIALVEEGRVVGLVTARILFETASSLTVGALSGGVIPPPE